jgi:hypothetical protein
LELEKAQEANKNILINWHYEKFDEDMKEVGEDFSDWSIFLSTYFHFNY